MRRSMLSSSSCVFPQYNGRRNWSCGAKSLPPVPDGMDGRRQLRDRACRHRRDLRARGAILHQERVDAGRRARHRHRQRSGAPGARQALGCRDCRFRRSGGDRPRDAEGTDGRARSSKGIDAVGAESHTTASFDAVLDKATAAVLLIALTIIDAAVRMVTGDVWAGSDREGDVARRRSRVWVLLQRRDWPAALIMRRCLRPRRAAIASAAS